MGVFFLSLDLKVYILPKGVTISKHFPVKYKEKQQ